MSKGLELLIAAGQLVVAAVVAYQLLDREDQVPIEAIVWRGVATGSQRVAATAGAVAIAAEARYYRAVAP